MNSTVPRERYLETLDLYRNNPELVKVITGIRRCGKSVLLKQFRKRLESEGKTVVYIDLESERYRIPSERAMYNRLRNEIEEDAFLLLDEVQLVKGWEKVVDTLRTEFKVNIYLTGSNAETVSTELGTHLTGRYVEIHVLPFSFEEFLLRYPVDRENGYEDRLEQFLNHGGMPIIDIRDDEVKNRTILKGIYDSIVNNDIRPTMSMEQLPLENLTTFMMSNIGNPVSAHRIAQGAGIGDPRTVEKYLSKLCECFIFYKADKYDIVGRRHLSTNAKFYTADTGLRNSVIYGKEYNIGSLLENAIYLELLRRGLRVSTGSFRSTEVDLTAWDMDGPSYYQVAYTVADEQTLSRELRPLVAIGSGKRTLITADPVPPEVPEGIDAVSAVDFFLGPWNTDGKGH